MKHFRDLVLSTREPALHNVLWIEPIKDEEGKYIWGQYQVKMYEDGWKLLLGNGNSENNDLQFKVEKTLPNGEVIIQLYDASDPNNKHKAYPITRASFVYMSNGRTTVEEAINNLNTALANISSSIKKAFIADEHDIDTILNKQGKTFWVHSAGTNGVMDGEKYLRKYTTDSSYTTTEQLGLGDIIIDLTDDAANHRLHIVDSISTTAATVYVIANYADIFNTISLIRDNYLRDVKVDNDSVVTTSGSGSSAKQIANINRPIREVYMVSGSDAINTLYPTGKQGKIFFYEEVVDSVHIGHLIKYTSNNHYIPLEAGLGDLFFNLGTNLPYQNKQLYILKLGTYESDQYTNVEVEMLPDVTTVEDYVYSQVRDAMESASDKYLRFTASNPVGTNPITWDIVNESGYTIGGIADLVNEGVTIYAAIYGIAPQVYGSIPIILPLYLNNNNNAVFTGIDGSYSYQLNGTYSNGDIWSLYRNVLQSRLTFDSTPTEGSTSPVTSGGVYDAIAADDTRYVLLNDSRIGSQKTSYSERLEVTPKFHRVEFLDNTDVDGEYDVWDAVAGEGIITDSSTKYEGGGAGKALGRFQSLWFAVMECNDSTGTAGAVYDLVPKIILRYGNVACYCTSDELDRNAYNSALINDPTQIILKFFDGTDVITYQLDVQTANTDYPGLTVIKVTKTTQSVTLT